MDEAGAGTNRLTKSRIALIIYLFWSGLSAKDFMIMTFPSSGSSWFTDQMQASFGLERCRYKSEVFNVLGTGIEKGSDEQRDAIFAPLAQADFEEAYNKEWVVPGYNVGKEIHGYMRFPLYQEKFDIVCLYRDRRHMFPSGKPVHIKRIYDAFMAVEHDDKILAALKTYLKQHVTTDLQKQVAIHIVASYITFKHAENFKTPILEYDKLLRLSKPALAFYLKERLPETFYSRELLNQICQTREAGWKHFCQWGRWQGFKRMVRHWFFGGPDWIDLRELKYAQLNIEPFCQDLLAHMKTLDKDFKQWHYLA